MLPDNWCILLSDKILLKMIFSLYNRLSVLKTAALQAAAIKNTGDESPVSGEEKLKEELYGEL